MHAVGFGFSLKLLAAGDSFELPCGSLCVTKRFNCVNEEQVLTGGISTLQLDANKDKLTVNLQTGSINIEETSGATLG